MLYLTAIGIIILAEMANVMIRQYEKDNINNNIRNNRKLNRV